MGIIFSKRSVPTNWHGCSGHAVGQGTFLGQGAVLMQERHTWKPVAYASRTMSEIEHHYHKMRKRQ